jgi:hypothetical protein
MTGQPHISTNAYLWATAGLSGLAMILAAVVTIVAPDADASQIFMSQCLDVAKIGVGAFAVIRLGNGGTTAASPPPLPPPK